MGFEPRPQRQLIACIVIVCREIVAERKYIVSRV